MSTHEEEPVLVPAWQARGIADLLGITEHLLSALLARSAARDTAALASIEELSAMLAGGSDAATLVSRLDQAQRDLARLFPVRETS